MHIYKPYFTFGSSTDSFVFCLCSFHFFCLEYVVAAVPAPLENSAGATQLVKLHSVFPSHRTALMRCRISIHKRVFMHVLYLHLWLTVGGRRGGGGKWGSCRCEWLGFLGGENRAVKVIRRRVLLWENITSGGAVAENIMQRSSFRVVTPRGQQKHLSPPEVTR